MEDVARDGVDGHDPFEVIDPKLNVFALANGMDLGRGAQYRRLEWFTEGFERGILIEQDTQGAFRLEVLSWPTGSEEIRSRTEVAAGLSPEALIQALEPAIETANGL